MGGTTANVTGLNCTTSLTVALWSRFVGSGGGQDIIRQSSTANTARSGWRCGFTTTTFLLAVFDNAGATSYNAIAGSPHRDGKWHHYAVTYDSATDQVRGYVDGILRTSLNNATRNITANALCTTNLNPNNIGSNAGYLFFDLQIFPDVVVPAQDVRLLMNPLYKCPGLKGRYFGINFRTTAAGANALQDESGSGNNLTISPTAFQQGAEPPYLPTYQ